MLLATFQVHNQVEVGVSVVLHSLIVSRRYNYKYSFYTMFSFIVYSIFKITLKFGKLLIGIIYTW